MRPDLLAVVGALVTPQRAFVRRLLVRERPQSAPERVIEDVAPGLRAALVGDGLAPLAARKGGEVRVSLQPLHDTGRSSSTRSSEFLLRGDAPREHHHRDHQGAHAAHPHVRFAQPATKRPGTTFTATPNAGALSRIAPEAGRVAGYPQPEARA